MEVQKIQETLTEVLAFFKSERSQSISDKEILGKLLSQKFKVRKERSLFIVDDVIAIRFSHSKIDRNTSSNTVLAIKKIKEFDNYPILSVLVTPGTNYVEIMNTTFIKKVSHSSKKITYTNLVGSINYTDIMKEYAGTPNIVKEVSNLYKIHQSTDHDKNLKRIVDNTQDIKPIKHKYIFSKEEKNNILSIVQREDMFIENDILTQIEKKLDTRVNAEKKYILRTAQLYDHNVNLRGRIIEKLISGDSCDTEKIKRALDINEDPKITTKDDLADYELSLSNYNIGIDIKSSALGKDSQPKGIYIDDMLKFVGQSNTIFLVYLVGIKLESQKIMTKLVPMFDKNLLKGSHIESAWSGRDTRGHIQFDGKSIHSIETNKNYHIETMSKNELKKYIDKLIEL